MPPADHQNGRDAAKLHANLVSLRDALLAMQAKVEYVALMLRLDEARKVEQAKRRLNP